MLHSIHLEDDLPKGKVQEWITPSPRDLAVRPHSWLAAKSLVCDMTGGR